MTLIALLFEFQKSVGCPKESFNGEKRVAQSPDTVTQLVKKGVEVRIESTAGVASNWSDEDYNKAGKEIHRSSFSFVLLNCSPF